MFRLSIFSKLRQIFIIGHSNTGLIEGINLKKKKKKNINLAIENLTENSEIHLPVIYCLCLPVTLLTYINKPETLTVFFVEKPRNHFLVAGIKC